MSDERQPVGSAKPQAGPRRRRGGDRRAPGPERYPPVRRDDAIETPPPCGREDIDVLPGAESDA